MAYFLAVIALQGGLCVLLMLQQQKHWRGHDVLTNTVKSGSGSTNHIEHIKVTHVTCGDFRTSQTLCYLVLVYMIYSTSANVLIIYADIS